MQFKSFLIETVTQACLCWLIFQALKNPRIWKRCSSNKRFAGPPEVKSWFPRTINPRTQLSTSWGAYVWFCLTVRAVLISLDLTEGIHLNPVTFPFSPCLLHNFYYWVKDPWQAPEVYNSMAKTKGRMIPIYCSIFRFAVATWCVLRAREWPRLNRLECTIVTLINRTLLTNYGLIKSLENKALNDQCRSLLLTDELFILGISINLFICVLSVVIS